MSDEIKLLNDVYSKEEEMEKISLLYEYLECLVSNNELKMQEIMNKINERKEKEGGYSLKMVLKSTQNENS